MNTTLQAWRIVQLLACVAVLRVVATVLLSYSDYFPPNFRSDFLLGRSDHFFGAYQIAFYAHITSGPLALLSGLVLLSESVRRRFPAAHRWLGRMHVAVVLFLVAPSGLWMAQHPLSGGVVAAVGFATLAVLTGACAVLGWRAAAQRRFHQHRDWMWRCFALVSSAVVLRAMGGLADALGVEGAYRWAAWLSWLLPLAFVEWLRWSESHPQQRPM